MKKIVLAMACLAALTAPVKADELESALGKAMGEAARFKSGVTQAAAFNHGHCMNRSLIYLTPRAQAVKKYEEVKTGLILGSFFRSKEKQAAMEQELVELREKAVAAGGLERVGDQYRWKLEQEKDYLVVCGPDTRRM